MDNLSAIATAKEEGIAEGLEKGKEEGKLEERKQLALNMKNKGFDDSTLSHSV